MISIADLRSYKIFKMAIFDLVATFLVVWGLHFYMWSKPFNMKDPNKRTIFQYISSLSLLFVAFIGIGVIVHYFVGVQSALSAYLGFNDMPVRL